MTEIIKYELDNGQSVELSPETVRSYLVNGNGKVTEQEVHMFMKLCQYQRINPFLREAYLIKYGDAQPASIVTGKELFTKRAEKHEDFDGYEAGVIVLTKENKLQNRPGTTYLRKYGEELIGGWARVHRKSYKIPIESTAMFDEYTTGKSIWATKPATMIRKVALMQALREAFPDMYGGLYSQEEMPIDGEKLPTAPVEPPPEAESKASEAATPPNSDDCITTKQAKLLFAGVETNEERETVRKVIAEFGYGGTKEILKKDFDSILKRLADEKLKQANPAASDPAYEGLAFGGDQPDRASRFEVDPPFDDELPFGFDQGEGDIPA